MRWNIFGRWLFGRRSSGRRSSSRRSLGRRPPTSDKYLIEFRFQGYAKKTLRELRESIAKNFNARIGERRKEVPHITIVGTCRTRDRKRLIREVENVVKKYDLVGFKLGGFGYFPGRAIYVDILPSKELVEMRQKLVERLGKFCRLQDHDYKPEFNAHSTLCMNTHFSGRAASDIERTFDKILEFLGSWKIPEMYSYVLRVTILDGNSRIVREYDLIFKKMMNRKEALDRDTFKKTIDASRKKYDMGANNVRRPGTTDEDDYPGRVFVISDLHFNHKNIIRFCNRPFRSTREMNRALVDNWNRVVDDEDRVYCLGDMTYGRRRRPIDFWLSKLNGEIRFIRGNHDTDIIRRAEVIKDKFPIRYRGREFLLMHDPYRPSNWDGWIIHGDKHNNDLARYPHVNCRNKTINVCVELVKYTPISLDEIISKISRC